MGYVGLFIISREPLIPLNDGGLTVPGNGCDWLVLSGMLMFSAFATAVTIAVAVA